MRTSGKCQVLSLTKGNFNLMILDFFVTEDQQDKLADTADMARKSFLLEENPKILVIK